MTDSPCLRTKTHTMLSVSDPRSSSYRHFLTAAQYHARYDATGAPVVTTESRSTVRITWL